MSWSQRVFATWFAALMLSFVLANLAGIVRPMGLKPIRVVGFPFTISTRTVGVEEFFDWSAVGLDALVAVGVSGLVAFVCAWGRCRRVPDAGSRHTAPGREGVGTAPFPLAEGFGALHAPAENQRPRTDEP
jgi:hypothetical protein